MKFLFTPLLLSVVLSLVSPQGEENIEPSEISYTYYQVEIVDYTKCKFQLTPSEFYSGIIAGFALVTDYKYPWFDEPERPFLFQRLRNELKITRQNDYSNYNGPIEEYANPTWKDWFNWHWLSIGTDVRSNGPIIEMHALGGMGHFFIPLLHPDDSRLSGKRAYMLHVIPHREMLPGTLVRPTWYQSVYWIESRDPYDPIHYVRGKYSMWMDLSRVFRGIDSFTPNLTKSFNGYAEYDEWGYLPKQTPNANQQPFTYEFPGPSYDHICSSEPAIGDMTSFKREMKRVMPWL